MTMESRTQTFRLTTSANLPRRSLGEGGGYGGQEGGSYRVGSNAEATYWEKAIEPASHVEFCDPVGRCRTRFQRTFDAPISRDLHGGDDATIAFSMSEERDPVVTESMLKSALTSALNDLENRLENRLETRITNRLEKRITEEGKTTRRRFNIMVEKVNESVKLVAEVTSHHSTVLDDHEARLQKIERR